MFRGRRQGRQRGRADRTGRNAGAAATAVGQREGDFGAAPDLRPESNRAFRAGVAATSAVDTATDQAGIRNRQCQSPGRPNRRRKHRRLAGCRTVRAETAGTVGKVDPRPAALVHLNDFFRANFHTGAATGAGCRQGRLTAPGRADAARLIHLAEAAAQESPPVGVRNSRQSASFRKRFHAGGPGGPANN